MSQHQVHEICSKQQIIKYNLLYSKTHYCYSRLLKICQVSWNINNKDYSRTNQILTSVYILSLFDIDNPIK